VNNSQFLLNHKHAGFTLIELTITIILISIMAVTVLPKFFQSNGFEEYTYRDELISKLRAIQLRSMQQIDNSTCRNIEVTSNEIGLFATDFDPDAINICKTSPAGETTTVTIDSNHSVSFTVTESLSGFSFSPLGKPVGCTPIDTCKITITITGESGEGELTVEINQEGYIHAS